MICDSNELFSKSISGFITPDDLLFEKMQSYLRNANRWVRMRFVGVKLYDYYDELDDIAKDGLCQLVALRAFHEAIPYIDLTLTSTGFGIVNNSQVAPASKERVNRLREQVAVSAEEVMDYLLSVFLEEDAYRELFQDSPVFKLLTSSLFIYGFDMSNYSNMEGTRITLANHRTLITQAENELAKLISIEYYSELIDKVRTNTLAELDYEALHQAKLFIGSYVEGNMNRAYPIAEQLVNYLRSHLDDFKTYAESDTYTKKDDNHYKNKKDGSCYSFI